MPILDVIEAVKRQFGDETGAMIVDDDIFRWINEGQFQIARRIGDVQNTTTIPVLVDDNRYSLPTDFFKVIVAELDGRRLQWATPATLKSLFPSIQSSDAQAGAPVFFTVEASNTTNTPDIILAPKPAATGSLYVQYQRRPPLVNSSSDALTIPTEYESTLITWCLGKAKQLDGDDEASIALKAEFQKDVDQDAHDSRHKSEETYPVIRPSLGDVGWGDWG